MEQAELVRDSLEIVLEEHERIVIVGAGGKASRTMYLNQLTDGLGIDPSKFVLVDNNEERLNAIGYDPRNSDEENKFAAAAKYLDLDLALQEMAEQKLNPAIIFILSNTPAHYENFQQIANATRAYGFDDTTTRVWSETSFDMSNLSSDENDKSPVLDLTNPLIWSEKPSVPTDHRDRFDELQDQNPWLKKINVGYILRASEVIPELIDHALTAYTEGLSLQSIKWKYGKDRTQDTRPTAGIIDDYVHPISIDQIILQELFGLDVMPKVSIKEAFTQTRPLNPDVQEEAHRKNPEFPLNPISDIYSEQTYSFDDNNGGTVEIQSSMDCSFRFEKDYRQADLLFVGEDGQSKTLRIEFDTSIEKGGETKRYDRLILDPGEESEEVLFERSGNKALDQLRLFFAQKAGERNTTLATNETEDWIQNFMSAVGSVAVDATSRQD